MLTQAGITWQQTIDKFNGRWGHSDVPPMTAAIRRHLKRSETINEYFDEKSQYLRRAQIPENQMSDVLTEGLPEVYRSHFYGKRFQTIAEWLALALDIEADISHRGYKQQHKGIPSAHCQATIRHCDQTNTGANKKKPCTPCQICLKNVGQTNYHWHKDCPNRFK